MTALGVLGARGESEQHFNPATGQFLTRDPIEAITRSPYAYVYSNPINLIDPTGLGSSSLLKNLGTVGTITGILSIFVAPHLSVVFGVISISTGAPIVISDCLNGRDASCVLGGAALVAGGLGTVGNATLVDVEILGRTFKGSVVRFAPNLYRPVKQMSNFSLGGYGAGLSVFGLVGAVLGGGGPSRRGC